MIKGGKCKDFSDGEGFYFVNEFDEVLKNKWVFNRFLVFVVLVYRVYRVDLRERR